MMYVSYHDLCTARTPVAKMRRAAKLTAVAGNHCHRCDQKSRVHCSFVGIGHDLMHAIVHFCSFTVTMFLLLLVAPGIMG